MMSFESGHQIKVLFAESNTPYSRQMATELWESSREHFDIKLVAKGEEGLNVLRRENFDVILLELGNELDLTRSLEMYQAESKDTPIVLLGDVEDQQLADSLMRSGAHDYLVKNKINSGIVSRVLMYSVWRRRLMKKRKKISASYRWMFEKAALAMTVVDARGIVREANVRAEKALGVSSREMRGKKVTDLFAFELRPAGHDGAWHTLLNGQQVNFQEAGQPSPFTLRVVDYEDSDVDGSHYLLVLDPEASAETPVSESGKSSDVPMALKRQAYEVIDIDRKLGYVDQLKAEFLAMVAHEIKTPIAAIDGYFQLLGRELKDGLTDRQADLLARIQNALENLRQRSLELIQWSELEKNKETAPIGCIDISDYVRESFMMFEGAARMKSISTELETKGEVLNIWCNPKHIKTILNNLLSNAVKYTPHGGGVKLMVEYQKGGVLISVSDTGIGIEPSDQNKIFEPFQGVRKTQMQGQTAESTGLGLSLVKRIVEACKGSIEFNSAPQCGSEFRVFLPRDRRRRDA